jgi:hypothetical protein
MHIQPPPIALTSIAHNCRTGPNAVLDTFTVATFADHVGETFQIRADTKPVELALIAATDLTSRGGPGAAARQRAPFSIVFRGPGDTPLPQQIHRMQHAGIGEFEIFLVPVGPDREGMLYEAIFT